METGDKINSLDKTRSLSAKKRDKTDNGMEEKAVKRKVQQFSSVSKKLAR